MYLGKDTKLKRIVPLLAWFRQKVYAVLDEQRRQVATLRLKQREFGMSFDEAYRSQMQRTPEGLEPWRRMAKSVLSLASEVSRASRLHGFDHWERVAAKGIELCRKTPGADLYVMSLFAAFHDAVRFSDGHDPEHGQRGAELAHKLRGQVFEATDKQMKLLTKACRDHTSGRKSNTPTVACCWDADRLDLGRCGIEPDPAYLSTSAAKDLIRTT